MIPTWAPDSCVESDRRAANTPCAPASPDSAARSTVPRSTGDERELSRDERAAGQDQDQDQCQQDEQQLDHRACSGTSCCGLEPRSSVIDGHGGEHLPWLGTP